MTANGRIRLGIIGAGNIGNVHMETFGKLVESVELAGITDVYLPAAEARAKQHHIGKVYASSDDLINDPDIDAVVVAVSNEWHVPIGVATALIKLDNGATLSLDVSWAALIETDSKPYVHLLGSEGGAALRGSQGKLMSEQFEREANVELHVPANDEGSRVRMSRHFIECVREGKEPISSVMSGYTNNLILDAIYESSRTGREVQLNWDL